MHVAQTPRTWMFGVATCGKFDAIFWEISRRKKFWFWYQIVRLDELFRTSYDVLGRFWKTKKFSRARLRFSYAANANFRVCAMHCSCCENACEWKCVCANAYERLLNAWRGHALCAASGCTSGFLFSCTALNNARSASSGDQASDTEQRTALSHLRLSVRPAPCCGAEWRTLLYLLSQLVASKWRVCGSCMLVAPTHCSLFAVSASWSARWNGVCLHSGSGCVICSFHRCFPGLPATAFKHCFAACFFVYFYALCTM